MNEPDRGFKPYQHYRRYTEQEMCTRAQDICTDYNRRRSVRDFSRARVPRTVIDACLLAASSAPSGANRQPWKFVVVSNAQLKHRIRLAAEAEEREFYERRASARWLDDLAPLGTDASKPFLDDAPYLIVVFAEKWSTDEQGAKRTHYYVPESVGIATGMLLSALHGAGLATLTHTPAPMTFLRELLNRGTNERAFLIVVVGYPAEAAKVPDIQRKPLSEIAIFHD